MKKIRGFKPVKIQDTETNKEVKTQVQAKETPVLEASRKTEPPKEIDIASAQEVIAKEKEQRVQEFIEKLKALCEQYNVSLTSGDIIVKAL